MNKIRFENPYDYLILRKDFLLITDNNIPESLILEFLYEKYHKDNNIQKTTQANGIKINIENIKKSLKNIYSKETIKTALRNLRNKNFIIVKKDTKNKFDKTNIYFLNTEKINKEIQKINK